MAVGGVGTAVHRERSAAAVAADVRGGIALCFHREVAGVECAAACHHNAARIVGGGVDRRVADIDRACAAGENAVGMCAIGGDAAAFHVERSAVIDQNRRVRAVEVGAFAAFVAGLGNGDIGESRFAARYQQGVLAAGGACVGRVALCGGGIDSAGAGVAHGSASAAGHFAHAVAVRRISGRISVRRISGGFAHHAAAGRIAGRRVVRCRVDIGRDNRHGEQDRKRCCDTFLFGFIHNEYLRLYYFF